MKLMTGFMIGIAHIHTDLLNDDCYVIRPDRCPKLNYVCNCIERVIRIIIGNTQICLIYAIYYESVII